MRSQIAMAWVMHTKHPTRWFTMGTWPLQIKCQTRLLPAKLTCSSCGLNSVQYHSQFPKRLPKVDKWHHHYLHALLFLLYLSNVSQYLILWAGTLLQTFIPIGGQSNNLLGMPSCHLTHGFIGSWLVQIKSVDNDQVWDQSLDICNV